MCYIKALAKALFFVCLLSSGSHASAPLVATILGVMTLGFSTLIDVAIMQETNTLQKDYNLSQMVVIGYQINKEPCQVCVSMATRAQCVEAGFKARLKNEFLALVNGIEKTQEVVSESICGTSIDDANVTAKRRFPLGTTTPIWYKKKDPSIWQRADHPELTVISKLLFYGGGAAFLIGITLFRYEQSRH